MAEILITGGAGFIGGALAASLAAHSNNKIVIVDNLLTGSLRKIPVSIHRNIEFVRCDANDYASMKPIFEKYSFDYVFHYAALVGVKRTLDHPIEVLRDIDGIKFLLELSKKNRVKRIYYSSSSEVYGEPVHIPQNEHTTPLNSRLPYAIVKNVGEAYVRSFEKECGLEYTIFRFFNTYGPNQSEDFVVSKFIKAALNHHEITIYGDGSQTRTFCYIDDNIATCTSIFAKNLFVNDVVNIGSDQEISILELANAIVKAANSRSKIVHLPALEEGDMTRRQPDTTKMKSVHNQMLSLDQGLRSIIKSWSKN